jgi:hypothetical protein
MAAVAVIETREILVLSKLDTLNSPNTVATSLGSALIILFPADRVAFGIEPLR